MLCFCVAAKPGLMISKHNLDLTSDLVYVIVYLYAFGDLIIRNLTCNCVNVLNFAPFVLPVF